MVKLYNNSLKFEKGLSRDYKSAMMAFNSTLPLLDKYSLNDYDKKLLRIAFTNIEEVMGNYQKLGLAQIISALTTLASEVGYYGK